MKKNQLLAVSLVVTMAVSGLVGCGKTASGTGSKQSSSQGGGAESTKAPSESATMEATDKEPVYGGVLKIAIDGNVSAKSLDPYYIDSGSADQIAQQYGDTLVRQNAEGTEFMPNVATSWKVSDDGLDYTFTIRDDVYFQKGKYQDGRVLTADDVVYSLTRAKGYWCNYLSFLDNVEKLDDKTVVCHLTYPNATFLYQLVHTSTVMVAKEEVEGWGEDYGMHVIGTGAFKVTDHAPEQYTKLERSDNYWGVKPYLDGLEYVNIRDASQALNALLTGEIDVNLAPSSEAIGQIRTAQNLALCQRPINRVAEFGFNMKDKILSDNNVRKALIMAVDYSQLAMGTFKDGTGSVGYVPLPKTSWGYDPSMDSLIPAYDVEGAKALLKEAGYADGFTLDVSIGSDEESLRSATILQAFYEQVGVKLNIKTVSTAEITEQFQKGTFQIFRRTQAGSTDPATFIGYFFSSDKLGTNYNAWGYSDPDMDALIASALAENDQQKRKEIYNEIMKKGSEANVGMFFANLNLSWGLNSKVHGYVQENNAVMRICGTEETGINVWKEQ